MAIVLLTIMARLSRTSGGDPRRRKKLGLKPVSFPHERG